MPAKRTAMRIIKELLRLKFEARLSQRQIARCLKMGLGTVSQHLCRAKALGLTWPLPDDVDDSQLEALFYPKAPARSGYIEPDYAEMHSELKNKGITKQLLWEEYKQAHDVNGYQYSQYCQRYRNWVKTLQRSMRQIHKAGEKLFVDYCGQTISIVNSFTGEITRAQIFVATLGASSYTYAEATRTQTKPDWIQSHINAFNFLGGVPEIIVPDQLKSAVTTSCRYEPKINASYQHMASHYKTAIIPARPRKPKDKSKVENAVLVVERWILARLRKMTFFSLAELNQHIRFLLEDLNQRPFKKLKGSRASQFEMLDKPALRSLPLQPYQYTECKLARVNIDYHIEYNKRYYSVPHHLVKHQVEVQATRDTITIYFNGKQVAKHPKQLQSGHYITNPAHMPESHRKHAQWSPERILSWAQDLGPYVLKLTQKLFDKKAHPEQAYRACLGLLNLSRKYDAQRLNEACNRALNIGSCRLQSVKSILQNGLDQQPLNEPLTPPDEHDHHDNIRGPEYYH